MEFLTMIPARAMKPIMEVAVKFDPSRMWPGMTPMRARGMGLMITSGVMKLSNSATMRR
jgi:hypothetical protein